MALYEDSLGLAAEACGVLVHPGDTATYLRRHHTEVPAHFLHRNEVQGDVMRPGIDEHLRGKAVLFCRAHQPVPTMDEDEDRRISAFGPINIEFFDLRWSVRSTLGCAETDARGLTVAGEALRDL